MLRVAIAMLRTQTLSRHLCERPALSAAFSSTSAKDKQQNETKAVIFDMGGVIVPSPGLVFMDFESKLNLPTGTFLKVIKYDGQDGAWAKLERGEISWDNFSKALTQEVSNVAGKQVDLSSMLDIFQTHEHKYPIVNQEIVDAIKCIRAEGIQTALLTNNWLDKTGTQTYLPVDRSLFDVIVESCKIHIRKPDPRAYQTTLDQLKVAPHEAIFLDDLGMNLKVAKEMGIRTIKVTSPVKATEDLSKEIGFDVRCFAHGTTIVPKRLEIPIPKLKSYLNSALNLHSKEEPVIRCYSHGQSNPTYFVRYGGKDMVLRKKPPGKLLPSAHAVEREYRVMKALSTQGIPVPRMLGLCEDSSLLGTPFYMMEYVEGRIFKDPTLPGMSGEERRQIYSSMCDTLAKIHNVDIDEAGLGDFGKRDGYMMRNFKRWTKQYEASKTDEIPAMDKLKEWLLQRMPQNEKCTVIHGDYRLDNLIYHPTKPEVIAVLDWELSTLGDPLSDLAGNLMGYYFPDDFPSDAIPGFTRLNGPEFGLPSAQEYGAQYHSHFTAQNPTDLDFYAIFTFYRMAAILQGVYKRFTIGQASSPSAEAAGLVASVFAEAGWTIASGSNIPVNTAPASPSNTTGRRNYSTMASDKKGSDTEMFSSSMMNAQNYSTSKDRVIPGMLPLSVSALSPRAQDYYKRVVEFIKEEITTREKDFFDFAMDHNNKWKINPLLEELKAKAKAKGLWNLFLPIDSDPDGYGPQLTNIEYAYICEELGKSPLSSEIFNCSAPDTGNMEVLIRYATPELKRKYLEPLLDGKVRSCFAMTEPAVASSDATNIQSSIRRDGNEYVINGHKWWTSGAMDPRCKFAIFMGKTSTDGPIHRQQSMVIVPMDAPGVKILRYLTVLGYDDSPHGHAEVLFENVRVPIDHLLLGEGRGFEIAQGRLGPGRIHHCMRMIGSAERALELMVHRVQNRVAFGKPLAAQGTIQQDIARSRLEIEQCRLLVLKAAHMMDTVGNKVAAPDLAMIKVAVPNMTQAVVDRAIQSFGGLGLAQDTPLAPLYTMARVIRIADGPDEVHLKSIFRMEARTQNLAKL